MLDAIFLNKKKEEDEKKETKEEKWNRRLREKLTEKKLTQELFADELNDKYRSSENDDKFTQPTISSWLHVGNKRGNSTVGFPKFENMLMIADFFNVQIGYLIGETNAETFTLEKASDFLHLEPNVLTNLKEIIETVNENPLKNVPREINERIQYEQKEYSLVLNNLLGSKSFRNLVDSMMNLENTYEKYKGMVPNLNKLNEADLNNARLNFLSSEISDKYGENISNQAWKYYDISEYENPFNLTDEEYEAEKEISNIPPCFFDKYIRIQSDWKTIKDKSLALLEKMTNISNKHGEEFLKKIWSVNTKHLDLLNLIEEQKQDIYSLKETQRKFVLYINGVVAPFSKGGLTPILKKIEGISEKYPNAVLEKAWEYHKICEAIKDVNNAIDDSTSFLDCFKNEMGFHRFLVQEQFILLLNEIYPTSVDLQNIL